jgi:hypothetical protein
VTFNVTWYVPGAVYVWFGVTAVLVAPSPKFHAYVIVPSGSLEPDPSKLQASWVQLEENAACGGWFVAPAWFSTIVQPAADPAATLVLAVYPPYVPCGIDPFESATSDSMVRLPVSSLVVRAVSSGGAVHVNSDVARSPQ